MSSETESRAVVLVPVAMDVEMAEGGDVAAADGDVQAADTGLYSYLYNWFACTMYHIPASLLTCSLYCCISVF